MSLPPNQMHDTLPLIFTITPTRHFCNINTIFYFHYERFSHTDLVLNTIIYNACSNWFQFPTVTHLVHMQPLFLHLQKWLLQVTLFQYQFYQHIKTDRPIEAETTQKRNEFLHIVNLLTCIVLTFFIQKLFLLKFSFSCVFLFCIHHTHDGPHHPKISLSGVGPGEG